MGLPRTEWIGGGGRVLLPVSSNSYMRQGRPVLLEVLFVQCVTEPLEERVTRPNISAWMKEESL